jgi:hypothetical protein
MLLELGSYLIIWKPRFEYDKNICVALRISVDKFVLYRLWINNINVIEWCRKI